jgi:hypothetical protein
MDEPQAVRTQGLCHLFKKCDPFLGEYCHNRS